MLKSQLKSKLLKSMAKENINLHKYKKEINFCSKCFKREKIILQLCRYGQNY